MWPGHYRKVYMRGEYILCKYGVLHLQMPVTVNDVRKGGCYKSVAILRRVTLFDVVAKWRYDSDNKC